MRGIIFISLFLIHCIHLPKEYTSSSLDYFFNELQIKEYEKMSELISLWMSKLNTPIQPSQTESPESLLKDLELGDFDEISQQDYSYFSRKAFLVVLSRPPRDRVNQRLIQNLRTNPFINENYFSILRVIAKQSSLAIKNKERSPLERATHFYILENIIAEIRPFSSEKKEAQEILQIIVNADIKIPQDVHRERYVYAMQPQTSSPSALARQILKKIK